MTRSGAFAAAVFLGWILAQPAWAERQQPDCARLQPVPWQAVVPGVWAWLPVNPSEAAPENLGHVLATVIIVHGAEALVVDPGPHFDHGWRVRASLHCRFGARPVGVVNTHAHAKNVLANAAFADLQKSGQLAIMASAGTSKAMPERCAACLNQLARTLGEAAMLRTRITLPDRTLVDGEELTLGTIKAQVLVAVHAHTESDLMLWLPAQKVLLAGGLVYGARLPELAQGTVTGWLGAMQRITALEPAIVISDRVSEAPEAGGLPPAIVSTHGYLRALRKRLTQAMDKGLLGSETQFVTWPEYSSQVDFDARQGLNVQRAWRELEADWMSQPAPNSSPKPD